MSLGKQPIKAALHRRTRVAGFETVAFLSQNIGTVPAGQCNSVHPCINADMNSSLIFLKLMC